ncbi:fibronectin type III domain-containing protein [Streptomyces sp. NPDC049879]|uniref:fibronectin type III domain-containing protein n=1 Tax=Streptomyces sp. NPDC049879 TaxID=3365598 RepID=UPI003791B8D3
MAICPTIVEGDRIRITRVDACGRPVYGECNAVVTDGLVSIKLTPEVEEGEEKSQVNFAGRNCYSRPGCDTVKWWTVEITWCAINFAAFEMINPTYRLRRNDEGEVIGYYASNSVDCSRGYAVEVWAQVEGAADACTGEEGSGAWVYIPLPWIAGGTPGEITIGGEDSINFVTTGKTRNGSRWGRGPYNVEIVNGVPAPLAVPLNPDEPMGVIVTTVAPPEMDCDCQDVPRPVPDPATLFVEGVATEDPRNTVRLRVDNAGLGPVMVDWGDGTPPQEVADLRTVEHKYAPETPPQDYTITVCDKQDAAVCATKTVTIPLPPDRPELEVTPTPTDEFPYRVSAVVTLPSQASGTATITWGDGKSNQVTVDESGTATLIHDYPGPNRYTVVAKRDDKASYTTRQVVTVTGTPATPPAAPTAVTGSNPTPTGLTATWTWAQGDGPAATGFEVRYRTPAGTGTWSAVQTAGAAARELPITGLTAGTEYELEVVAVAPGAKSDPALGTGTTSAAEVNPPAAPATVEAVDPTADGLTVNWTWTKGTGATDGDATGFAVRYRTPADTGTWSEPLAAAAADRTLALTGLEPSTEYEVEVVATGDGGTSAATTATGTTTA